MLLIYKDEIIKKIAEEYPKLDKDLVAIILYGSVVRGDYTPISDIDILLVTNNVKKTRKLFSDFREKIFTKTGVIISATYVTPKMLDELKIPLIESIKKEGKILWKK
ncbi:MAG: nucleotidyltransferase domain-containing protein [Candidatus Asgardarchaeia archaeon]